MGGRGAAGAGRADEVLGLEEWSSESMTARAGVGGVQLLQRERTRCWTSGRVLPIMAHGGASCAHGRRHGRAGCGVVSKTRGRVLQ
jgi:hypothetical protein